MRKIHIETLLADERSPKLDHQNEFILNLYNDNYSDETIYNYNRDLMIFANYLAENHKKFEFVDKYTITYFKGWLKQRKHVPHEEETVKKLTQKEKAALYKALKDAAGVEEKITSQKASRQSMAKSEKADYKGGYVKNNNPEVLDAMSINRILVSLRKYLKYLVEYDYKYPIAPDAVSLVREPKKKPQVPALEEVILLIESPTQLEADEEIRLRNRAMLETLLATGMRISELISLNRNQLNSQGKLFITGKGKKQRLVYLTDRANFHLNAYLNVRKDHYPSLFLPKRGSRLNGSDPRISTNYLQMKIAQYRRYLEIVVPISAHSIRHAYATYLVENGANPAAIQVLLGHESLQTTTRYVHIDDQIAEKAHREFHPASNK